MAQNSNKSEESKFKPLKDAPPPPLPFAHHVKEGTKEENRVRGKDDKITISEALAMLAEMKKGYEKMDRLMSQALEATGWTPRYLKNYLDNPSNFPDGEAWAEAQKKRKELNDSLKSAQELKEEAEKAKKNPQLQGSLPHDPKIAKERRSKTVGQRRNWMPMR